MRVTTRLAISVPMLGIGLLVTSSAYAADILVPGDYKKLAQALKHAQPGDRILVAKAQKGMYRVTTPGITIEGTGEVSLTKSGGRKSRGSTAPIVLVEADGVTVRNLDFQGGGVEMWGDASAVEDCSFQGCTSSPWAGGAISVHGAGLTVTGNSVAAGPGHLQGIEAIGEDVLVEGNVVDGVLGGGINAWGDGVVVRDNEIDGMVGSGPDGSQYAVHEGILVSGDGAVVQDNAVESVEGERLGIWVSGDAPVVSGNDVWMSEDAGVGILVDGSDGWITDNDATTGVSTGILVRGSDDQVVGNRVNGRWLPDGSPWLGHGLVVRGQRNMVTDNAVDGAAGDGLRVVGGSGTGVERVGATGCNGCGIVNFSINTTCTGSVFLDNGTDVVNVGTFDEFSGNDFDTGSPDTDSDSDLDGSPVNDFSMPNPSSFRYSD